MEQRKNMSPDVNSRVSINAAVRSGQAIIRGTRTAVADILDLLASGVSHSEILTDFPWLTPDDSESALSYSDPESGMQPL
jgi:uncharacterized protein (DUF433 family)